jgi:hypothetical protein
MTKDTSFRVDCDMLAAFGTYVEAVSVVAPQTSVKALRACLCSNVGATFYPHDKMPFKRRSCEWDSEAWTQTPSSLTRQPGGYDVRIVRLGYDMWHLLALSREPGFMPCLTEPALNKALRSPQYTTPFLREWLPWLAQELASPEGDSLNPRLRLLDGFQSHSALLTATTPELDALVTRGLSTGAIRIPEKGAA